jgi:hypothetical protein
MTKDLISYAEGIKERIRGKVGRFYADKHNQVDFEGKSSVGSDSVEKEWLTEISTLLTKMVGEIERGKLLEAAFSPERLAQKQMFNKAKSEDIKLLQDTIEIIKGLMK